MLIQWNNELSVGIDSIDEQHKKLINMINTLNEALAEGEANEALIAIFDDLADYTVSHFGYEEKLFAQHAYEQTESHINEHHAMIEQVQKLRQKMADGDFLVGVEVMVFLKDWLLNHILKTDKDYGQFLLAKGAS
ncbi:bacteriohemerythrin [sulfur-oxidizing endosymbiont of Gigantopelta aegis]|uniref:bacteriohemerythrin n=1 Tax=sulfur-oxidizing endosymbiont of Gigantopelta aegis TaxID=2794934 RepID=UPI0018DE0AF5|nr:bacteriohemerythrin [sulfur-oxidizing endosymbiont of Gigantopelta aegis]